MLFLGALCTNLFLASVALAAPRPRVIDAFLKNRGQSLLDGTSVPLIPVVPNAIKGPKYNNTVESGGSAIQYSSNWAGAVRHPQSSPWKTVTARFEAPTPKLIAGQTWAADAVWVGIDGDSCQSAILQTGIIAYVDNNNHITYDAWYEWWPAGFIFWNGFPILPKDEITATVTAYTKNSGIAIVHNHRTGQTVTQFLTSSSPLCQTDAEWIVEDYTGGNGQLVPLADWGKVRFRDAHATTVDGHTLGPKGSTIVAIVANGEVISNTKAEHSSLEVTYV